MGKMTTISLASSHSRVSADLEGLFSLILDHEEGDASVRALSMIAYDLRYLRGFDRGGGTGAQTIGAANFIAFQTVNLVKWLQAGGARS